MLNADILGQHPTQSIITIFGKCILQKLNRNANYNYIVSAEQIQKTIKQFT